MKKSIKLNLITPLTYAGLVALATLLTIAITSPLFIGSPSASALTYQDSVDLDFTFNPTLNLTITGGDLNIDGLTPGNYHDSNIITVTSGSNSVTGYTLYANVGSNTINYTDLRISSNNTNATNIFTSLSSNKGTLASFDGGTWGYSYSTDAGTTWISGDIDDPNVSSHTGYNGLPLYSSNSGIKLAKTTAPSNPSTIQFKIGAKASSTQASGTYTNTVNFISVGNVVTTSYTMNYVDTSNEATNMPNPTTGTTTNGIFVLPNTVPARINYVLKGWCSVNNSSDPTTCSGTTIAPGGHYFIGTATTSFTGSLYTIWQPQFLIMQEVANWKDTIALGQEVTVIDKRDGNIYTAAKLCMEYSRDNCINEKIWMTQNLDLIVGPAGVGNLTSMDSDINQDLGSTQGYTTTQSGKIIWTPNATLNTPATITKHVYGSPVENAVTDWSDNNSQPYQAEGGDYYVYTSGDTSLDGIYSSRLACITAGHTDAECSHYHIGNYYNWNAAVATNDSSAYISDLYVMPNSVCPAGWRLPNGLTGTNGNENITEFNQLALANDITTDTVTTHTYGQTTWVGINWSINGFNDFRARFTNLHSNVASMYFIRSGLITGSRFYNFSLIGYLWSSTLQSRLFSYYLEFASGNLSPANQNNRYFGFPVRCLAR